MLTCLFKTINKVHSNPNPLWKAILWNFFFIGIIEDCIQGVRNKGLDEGGGEQMSVVMQLKVLPICQLSVNPIKTLQNVFAILKKTEATFYCLLHFGWKGWVGCKNNWMFNFIFSLPPPPTFYFTLPPLTTFDGSVNGPFPSFKISCFLITRLSAKPFLWKWVLFAWK